MAEIRAYFAFRSPYSRLGLHKLARAGVAVQLVAFTGPPEGVVMEDAMRNPVKLAYLREDVLRMTRRMGLPLARPDPFDIDFTAANRAFVAAAAAGKAMDYAIAVSDARWGEGRNVSDRAVLRDCMAAVGLDPELAEDAQTHPGVANTLRGQRTLIERDQVFGVPFVVAGGRRYWGHDRIDLMLEELGGGPA